MKPLNAASWAQLQAANSSSITSITQVSSTLCNPKINVEATAQYAPQILVIDVMVGSWKGGRRQAGAACTLVVRWVCVWRC